MTVVHETAPTAPAQMSAVSGWLRRSAVKMAPQLVPPLLGVALILVSVRHLLFSAFPAMLINGDDLDAYYPLFVYFIDNLRHGIISYYQPFLFAGERLWGNATFQPNPIQIIVGLLFGPTAIFSPVNFLYVAEPIAGFLGMYVLLGAICKGLPSYTRALLALAYVFSFAYAILTEFPTMTSQFATLPWIIYFLALGQDHRPALVFAGLTAWLYVQFAYGFLQFSVYVIWLSVFFALFWQPRPKTTHVVLLLAAAGAAAALASAHWLFPLIDNLYFSEGAIAGRVVQGLDISRQLVPDFYLLGLFVPTVFANAVPWWPLWKDGWSALESFTAYQGLPITLLAIFGLFLAAVPRFFRTTYVFLVLTVVTPYGLMLLYIFNLGSTVPFGRQTALLGFVAPIVAAFTVRELNRGGKNAVVFAAWCSACALVFLTVRFRGFPTFLADYAFGLVRAAAPSAYNPDAEGAFLAANLPILARQFKWPFIVATVSAIVALIIYRLPQLQKDRNNLQLASLLTAGLCAVAVAQAFPYGRIPMQLAYVNELAWARAQGRPQTASLDLHHPLEDALIAAGAQLQNGPLAFRTHLDLYFGEHRQGANLTRHLAGALPEENRFRTLPTFLSGERIAVTSGYQNVIPQAHEYTEMMILHYGADFERALGERAVLHPYMLQAFGIRWVVRDQPWVTEELHGRPDYADDVWEKRFLATSKLIYSDDTYRLYEYTDARPTFDVPERIAFGKEAAETLHALEDPDKPWPVTAALPDKAIAALGADYASRLTTENGVQLFRQSGKIVKAEGDAGRWTRLEVEADAPAVVLIGTKFDPWWKATVNGRPTPLIAANGLFAAVPVPAGKSEIVVRLRPYSAWLGFAISAATFLAFGIGFAVYYRRLRRTGVGNVHAAGLRQMPSTDLPTA
jgi:hypothetical protein